MKVLSFVFLMLLLLSLLAMHAPARADELPNFTLHDYLHHAWTAQLVHFNVESLPAGTLTVAKSVIQDEHGAAYACQWSDVQLHPDGSIRSGAVWFVADLPADAIRTYHLAAGTPVAPNKPAVTARVVNNQIELDAGAGHMAVRLPALTAQKDAVPLSTLPAPIQAVRLPDGAWAGKGWLVGSVPIASAETTITADGPLFAEAQVVYRTAQGKSYVVVVRVEAGSPLTLISEHFNLPAAQNAIPSDEQTEPSDGGKIPLLCFSLSAGLSPDTARYRGHAATKARANVQSPDADREGIYSINTDVRQRQWSLLGWMSWWPDAGSYYAAYRQADGDGGPVLGIMRMFSGRWFNPTGVQVWGDPQQQLYLAAPLGITHQRCWAVDGVHDAEMPIDIYSGVFDPGTALDLGQRCWALYASTKGKAIPQNGSMILAEPNRQMIEHGEYPLDKLKDWTFAWESPRPVVRPRLHTPPEQAAAVLAQAPASKADDIIANQRDFVKELLDGNGALSRIAHFFPGTMQSRGAALAADYALASPQLTPAQRDELRALLAFQAQVLADRDYFPVGTGFHLGNPNMPLSLEACLALIGCELPDHPQAGRWVSRGVVKTTGAFDKYVEPTSGAWNECPHYMFDASLYQLFEVMFALRNSGYGDLFDRPSVKHLLEYAIGFMPPPDPRFGIRIIPTEGNTSLEGVTLLGWAAAAYAISDPDLSARLQWMWQEGGRLVTYPDSAKIIQPDLPVKTPTSVSTWYKGFGAILRNGFPDGNETYMAYRQGQLMSHYENGDQGSWHLYAKGAPLSLDFGSQYGPMMERPWLHNRISVDHKMDPMLQHQHDIDDFRSLPAADFVSGEEHIDTLYYMSETPYHPMEILPNSPVSKPEPIAPLRWRRSILFVKDHDLLGPNYFLVRDAFQGSTKPTDWSAWCLADDVQFTGNTARFTGQYGVDLDVVALSPTTPVWTLNQDAVPPPPGVAQLSYGPGVPGWPAEYQKPAKPHAPVMSHTFLYLQAQWGKMHPGKVFEERQICARMTQPVGGGYFAILYPRKHDGEPIPTYASWVNGMGAKLTLPTETHYVLLAPSAVQVKDGDLTMDATVAVVRRGKERLLLTLLQGQLIRVGNVELTASQPVTVEITGTRITGETTGGPQTFTLRLPRDGKIVVDGTAAGSTKNRLAIITVPAGRHSFAVE